MSEEMEYFTPKPGLYKSGYVFKTTDVSESRISGEMRTFSTDEPMVSVGFQIDDVIPIIHPKHYEHDTGEPYVPPAGEPGRGDKRTMRSEEDNME